MKKKLLNRALSGFPYGVCIIFAGTLLLSVISGGGVYLAAAPALVARCGSVLNAMLLQTLVCGLLGSVLSASSVIWSIPKWKTLPKAALVFCIAVLTILPVYYLLYWIERTWTAFLLCLLAFFVLFTLVTLFDYYGYKRRMKKRENQPTG